MINAALLFSHLKKSKKENNNFLTANVFSYGSSIIENKCFERWPNVSIRRWKDIKENQLSQKHINNRNIIDVINLLVDDLIKIFKNISLLQLQDHLYDNESINSLDSMRRNIYIIFGGGGNTYLPYQLSVIRSLTSFLGLPKDYLEKKANGWADRIIQLAPPEDLILDRKKKNKWMSRLYVAYGISFIYEDLPQYKLPHQLELNKKYSNNTNSRPQRFIPMPTEKEQICPYCRGQNPNCLHCDGKGVI